MTEESPPNAASGRRVAISRTVVNFWLDATLLVTFLVLCWISAILQFVFPAGAAPDAFQVWGATAPDWQNRQFWVLCVFAIGILLHVMLHWSWIMGVITTRFLGRKATRDNGAQTLIGVGLLLAILHLLALGFLAARISLTAVTP
ncbi:MAG: DUF4405 domain-containing protein [Planctomycetaceae bacterium]